MQQRPQMPMTGGGMQGMRPQMPQQGMQGGNLQQMLAQLVGGRR
jgi:hypothetical protein